MSQAQSLLEQLAHLPPWVAFWTIALATFVSEDIATITAGMAAAAGLIPWPLALTSAALGIWLGDLAYFLLGRALGFALFERRWFARLIPPETVARCRTGFARNGLRWIFLSRLMPGVRTATYLVAGCLRVPTPWFALTTLAAVTVWTPVLLALAWLAGDSVLDWLEHATWLGWAGALLTVFACWYALRWLCSLLSRHSRVEGP